MSPSTCSATTGGGGRARAACPAALDLGRLRGGGRRTRARPRGARRRDGRVDGAGQACRGARRATRARMTGRVYVAIDQGGHATRASAFAADGTIEGAAFVTIATQRTRSATSSTIRTEIVASVGTALAELARIVPATRWAAAGLAVQRSSIVCWDAEDGRPLAPVISWQDTRGAAWLRGPRAPRRGSAAPHRTPVIAALRREQAALVPRPRAGSARRCRAVAARVPGRSRACCCTGCWRSGRCLPTRRRRRARSCGRRSSATGRPSC